MSHETREKKSFKHQVDEIVALIKKAISKNDLKTASTNLNKLLNMEYFWFEMSKKEPIRLSQQNFPRGLITHVDTRENQRAAELRYKYIHRFVEEIRTAFHKKGVKP